MSNCPMQFWLKYTYIGSTQDISFLVVLSVRQLSSIDLIIIAGFPTVILFPFLPWNFCRQRRTFFRKYKAKTFWAFSLGSTKRILFCEQSCVEDEGSPECSNSLACHGAFKLIFFFSSRACPLEEAPIDPPLSLGLRSFTSF